MTDEYRPDDFSFSVPPEHSESNSILREVEVAGDAATPLTGPDETASGTDSNTSDVHEIDISTEQNSYPRSFIFRRR